MVSLIVKVKPAAAKDEIVLDDSGMLNIKIRERPVDGAANSYLVRFLSKEFNLAKSSINLEKGASSRVKKISLNINEADLDKLMMKYKK
jgi:uncharacterized protein (TIGR00251 family)